MRVLGAIFLILGLISVFVGLILFFPLAWGTPLTLLGIVMLYVGGKGARRKKRARIEMKIRKLELMEKQEKIGSSRVDLLTDKWKPNLVPVISYG